MGIIILFIPSTLYDLRYQIKFDLRIILALIIVMMPSIYNIRKAAKQIKNKK